MKGEDLRDARKELSWSRQQLADKTGLTLSAVAVIEQGKRQPREEEREVIQRVMLEQLGRVLEETGEHPVIEVNEEELARTGAWNGFRRGDDVKVHGEKGTFKFLYYYRDDTQEYVQVFGPIPGSVPRSRNPRAAHERSVRPARVLDARGKPPETRL